MSTRNKFSRHKKRGRKKGELDHKQTSDLEKYHTRIRRVLVRNSMKGDYDASPKKLSDETGFSRTTIYKHLPKFIKDGEIDSNFMINRDRINIWQLKPLYDTLDEVRQFKLKGYVRSGGSNTEKPPWICYEFCEGKGNRSRWKETIKYALPLDKELIPPSLMTYTKDIIANGKLKRNVTFAIMNIPDFIGGALLENIKARGLKLDDMPEKVLVACVIDTVQLKKDIEASAKMKK